MTFSIVFVRILLAQKKQSIQFSNPKINDSKMAENVQKKSSFRCVSQNIAEHPHEEKMFFAELEKDLPLDRPAETHFIF